VAVIVPVAYEFSILTVAGAARSDPEAPEIPPT